MIYNDFILELNLKLDKKKLFQAIVSSNRSPQLQPHQRKVAESEYLNKVKQEIPILGSLYNIYDFPPNFCLKTHIDSARIATLNIPLLGGKDSITKIYESNFSHKKYVSYQRLHLIEEDLEEIFNFTLTKPTIMRTDIPHSVQTGKERRLVLSWGLICSFDEARDFFQSSYSK